MAYGILNSSANTGAGDELSCVFSTPLTISSNQPEFYADTLSLVRVVSKQGVQRWEIEAELAPVDSPSEYFISAVVNGGHSPVYVRMPQLYSRTKVAYTTNLRTTGSYPAGVSLLPANGPLIPKGHFIRFSGHPKIYLVSDSTPTGGDQLLEIYPELRHSVAMSEVIEYGDRVTAKMRYEDSSIKGIRYIDGVLSSPGTVALLEDFT